MPHNSLWRAASLVAISQKLELDLNTGVFVPDSLWPKGIDNTLEFYTAMEMNELE